MGDGVQKSRYRGRAQPVDVHEIISLVSGRDAWHTFQPPRYSVLDTDGPNGVRGTNFFNSLPTAWIPMGTVLLAGLMHEIGQMMGEQCRARGAHVLMGPNTNMVRNPLCGRGFETFEEFPFYPAC